MQVNLVLNTEASFLFRAFFARHIKTTRKFQPFKPKHRYEKVLDAVKYFFWEDDLVYSLEDFHKDPEVTFFVNTLGHLVSDRNVHTIDDNKVELPKRF